MASLCGRAVSHTCRRALSLSAARSKKEFADPLDHATGVEKSVMLAELEGNDDPFYMKAIKRGPGTKDCPNIVPSMFKSRIVGCVCEDDQSFINWMWLHEGSPRRCECGFWFKLEQKEPSY